MNIEWKSFLQNRGAEFAPESCGDLVTGFGNPTRETRMLYSGDVIVDLSHYGLIAAHGEDTVGFLQGQLSNDCQQLNVDTSQLSAFCNPKGRVVSFMRLFQKPGPEKDSLYLHMPADRIEDTLKRLRMYIMRSKVTLENVSDNFMSIGLSGPKAEDLLQDYGITPPDAINKTVHHDDLSVIRIAGPHARFIIFGELDSMRKLWSALDVHAAPAGPAAWQLLDIQSGMPVIHDSISEQFVPHVLNLQLLDAINFKKGCYTGQEVIARMQYLGTLKKQMYMANIASSQAPVAGAKLYSKTFSDTQSCGQIVNAEKSADGSYDILAVVAVKAHDANDVHLVDLEGPGLGFKALPYSFPEPAEA